MSRSRQNPTTGGLPCCRAVSGVYRDRIDRPEAKLPSGEERTYTQGVAMVWPEHGKSGGYRIPAEASVPEPLELQKDRGPIRVHMRKVDRIVEIVGLD